MAGHSPSYQALLERASRAWGLDYVHEGTVPLAERLEFRDGGESCNIGIFTFNGRWSFCLDIHLVSHYGEGYGSCLKFCNPFETRDAALTAAVDQVRSIVIREGGSARLRRWAAGLLQPALF